MFKQELIEYCQENNIFYRSNWPKSRIQDSIDSQMTNDTKITKTCEISGLKYQIEIKKASRTHVHPELNWYITHREPKYKQAAKYLIAEGASLGWSNIKQFSDRINVAWHQIEEAETQSIPYDLQGVECAKVTKDKTIYLTPVCYVCDAQTNHKRFVLSKGDGLYVHSFYQDDSLIYSCYKLIDGDIYQCTKEEFKAKLKQEIVEC